MGLYLLIPTLLVIIASVLIVRAGAIALRMTGLDEKTAAFQALSAFTRAGFTTRESETVVSHPQRRRIITWLIILGNAGILAAIVTGTSSLTTSTDYKLGIAVAVLLLGIFLIYRIAQHNGLNRRWESLVERRLLKARFFSQAPRVEHLLRFVDGYGVGQVSIVEKSLAVDDPLVTKLKAAGLIALGIQRRDAWISDFTRYGSLQEGDHLVLYGELDKMEALFGR